MLANTISFCLILYSLLEASQIFCIIQALFKLRRIYRLIIVHPTFV